MIKDLIIIYNSITLISYVVINYIIYIYVLHLFYVLRYVCYILNIIFLACKATW